MNLTYRLDTRYKNNGTKKQHKRNYITLSIVRPPSPLCKGVCLEMEGVSVEIFLEFLVMQHKKKFLMCLSFLC